MAFQLKEGTYARDVNIGKPPETLTEFRLSTLITNVSSGFESLRTLAESMWEEIRGMNEWNWELVDQIIVAIDNLRSSNVVKSDSLSSKLDLIYAFAQVASLLRTSELTNIDKTLRTVVASNATVEEATEELKKIALGTGLVTGTDLDEEEV